MDLNGVRKAEEKDSYGTLRSFVRNAAPPRSQGFNIIEDRYKTVYSVRL